MRRLAIVVAFALGCAEDDDAACRFRLCSIDDEACVHAVAKAVACQRDVDPVVPEVRFLSRDDVLFERASESRPTPEQLEQQRQYFAAESLVGLMPAMYDPAEEPAHELENVVAFYDTETEEVTIISDSGVDDPADAYAVLVHEMVHVHQDAVWNLDALSEAHATTGDRFLGLRAVVEGDANLFGSLAGFALLGASPDDFAWDAYFADFQEAMFEQASMSETPPLDVVSLFAYAWGEAYMYPAWDSLDAAGLEAVVLDPPDSVRQVMRGYPGEIRSDINEDALLDPVAVPLLPGFTFLGGDHYSIWLINEMLRRTARPGAQFMPALDDVSADYFSAFRHEASGALAVVWRIRGGVSLSEAFDGTYWSYPDSLRSLRFVDGDLVLVAVGVGIEPATVFDSVTAWQSPSAAYEGAGLDGSARPHPIGCLAR